MDSFRAEDMPAEEDSCRLFVVLVEVVSCSDAPSVVDSEFCSDRASLTLFVLPLPLALLLDAVSVREVLCPIVQF